MTTTHGNPLADLASAEATLAHAIDAATAQVERLATNAIDTALARLEDAVRAAHGRIGQAIASMHGKAAELVAVLNNLATQTNAVLTLNVVPVSPATIQPAVEPLPFAVVPMGAALLAAVEATAEPAPIPAKHFPPLVREVIDTIAGVEQPHQHAREATQSVPADEMTPEPSATAERTSETHGTPSSQTGEPVVEPIAAAAACSSRETPEQTMARVLLPSHEPATATAKKRNRRGKAGQADAGSGAAG